MSEEKQINYFTKETDSETPQTLEPLQTKWKRSLGDIYAAGYAGTVRRIETDDGEHFYYCVGAGQSVIRQPGETVTKILAINEDLKPVTLTVTVKNSDMFGPQANTQVQPCKESMSQADIEKMAKRVIGGDF